MASGNDFLLKTAVVPFEFTRPKAKITARVFARLAAVVPPRRIEKVCRDPFDDYILAADKDVLVMEKYKDVQIITQGQLT